jgi:protein O-mannosyl-transferase
MNKVPSFPKISWVPGAGLLLAICFITYFPFFQNYFIWDDDKYLTGNPYLGNLDGLKQLWLDLRAMPQYYPLVFTSFWIEHQVWSLNPLGYHVDNVILHGLNTIILWRILSFLEIKGSWLVAALFAIHPVQVETVAWITERKNLLSGFFYFLSLYFFLRYYNPVPGTQDDQSKEMSWHLFGFSLFFFICALWSKTVACTLPAVILLIFWWKQNHIGKKLLLLMLPFFTIGLGFACLTIWLEKFNVGAIGHEWEFSFWDRFLIAGRALWFYMGKLAWPFPIIFTYPRWVIDDSISWQYFYPLSFLLLIFTLWVLRKSIGRGPLTGILFFAGSLFPALGFFSVYPMKYSFVADHFQYLPCIGVIAVFVSTGDKLLGKKASWAGFILSVGLLFFLGNITWNQGPVYKDAFSLWEDTIKKNPSAWMAHNNLGKILAATQNTEEAILHYQASIKAKPDYYLPHYNLGIALTQIGRFEEAIAHYRTSIKINPGYFVAHNNLGDTLVKTGDFEEGILQYKTAIKMKPDFVLAHYSLGVALSKTGKYAEAIVHYKTAIKIQPDYFLAHNNLANAFIKKDEIGEALFHYRAAIKIEPRYFLAHFNLGNALANAGKAETAITHFRAAIKIKPDEAQAHNNLGIALAKKGAVDEAMIHFETAIEIKPEFAMAHNNLGGILLMQQKYDAAITHFRTAIKIRPDYIDAQKNLAIALFRSKN